MPQENNRKCCICGSDKIVSFSNPHSFCDSHKAMDRIIGFELPSGYFRTDAAFSMYQDERRWRLEALVKYENAKAKVPQ